MVPNQDFFSIHDLFPYTAICGECGYAPSLRLHCCFALHHTSFCNTSRTHNVDAFKKKSGRQLVALGMKSGESLSIDTPAVQELIAKVADPQLTVCIASTKGIVSKSECSLTFVVLCCWLTHPTPNRTLTFYILLLVRCMITVPGPACNSW